MALKAIIVGAGIGGLATAIRLRSQLGCDVTVLEKNSTVGGRCNVLVDRGYHFDIGPSLLLMTDVYRDLFASAGENFDEHVKLVKMEPNYRVNFSDGSELEMSSDLPRMIENLEKIEIGAGQGYLRFLYDASLKYRIGRKKFVERNFNKASDFFSIENLMLLGKLNALNTLYGHVSKFFQDDRLRQAFSMQTMYLGISPFSAPAVYTLLAYTELAEDGLYFPLGGTYALPLAMAAVASRIGVEIETGVSVARIIVENGSTRGVQLEDKGFLPADIVISNADLPYTYTDLLQDRPAKYAEERWKKDNFTCSAFNLYLGTDKEFPQLRHHNFFLGPDYRKNFEAIFDRKEIPAYPSFYVNSVTKTDRTLAPHGGDNIFVLVPVPHLSPATKWDPDDIASFKDKVYGQLEDRGLTDLRKHVVVEHVYTPNDWKERFNLKYGAAFGLSHGLAQVGYFRPANRAAHAKGLYFVGASTAPGTGVPLVCIGAKLVVEQIAADLSNGRG